MKRLLLLPALLFCFSKTHAQNGRWMYLTNDHNMILYVDTLKKDIRQLDTYDGHGNVVVIWVKSVQKKVEGKSSFVESVLAHFVIDTTNNQYEAIAGAIYHNDVAMQSGNDNYLPWQDAIPESGAEVLITYCRALNNKQSMDKFIANAQLPSTKPSPSNKKKKSN